MIASPCSGQGFRFSSAIGEAVLQMVRDGRAKLGVSLFKTTDLVDGRENVDAQSLRIRGENSLRGLATFVSSIGSVNDDEQSEQD